MLKRRFFYGCIILLITVRGYGQVNLQTGSATFSLPIFNWQDDKSRLNSLIALSYNSGSGLKVNDLPSNVGQGWNLIAGGAVVRMQTGEPDDQWPREGTEWDITKYPAGKLYATVPVTQGCPTALTKYPIYGWKNQFYSQHNVIAEDKQLDYFSFQFNGKAGMFVVDPANIGNCKSIGDTKLKITFQQDAGLISQGIRTRITSFSIQDVDGLIYKFARHGLVKILKSEYCDAGLTQYQRQPKFESGKVYHQAGFDNGQIVNPWVIGSWYLTEIEDPLTTRKIIFNYVTRDISNNAGEDVIFNGTKNYAIIFHKKSIAKTPALTSITFPDGHAATVNYGAARLDLNGDYAVASIDLSYQGRYLSKHELVTSYFIQNRYGTPTSDFQKNASRLCLLSVRKIGPDLAEDTPPYKFDYYTGSNTPDDIVPRPFSFAKDIWGFYNGDQTKGFWYENLNLQSSLSHFTNSNWLKGLCYLRHNVSGIFLNPKTGYARNGLLRQIIYPTGGTLSYEYEQNTGILGGTNREVGGVHVSKTSSTDGGFSNGCANPLTTEYSYTENGPGSNPSLWGLEMPINYRTTHNHYKPEYKYYKWSFDCVPFGCCDWKFRYPGIESMQQFTDLSGFQKFMEAASPIFGIVSLISTIQNVITVCSGGNPVALIIDVILGLVQVGVTCIGNQERNSASTMYFSANLHDAAPLPTQFRRVEIKEGAGGIGKTVQEFTSDYDYPIWEQTNTTFSSKQRFAPWAYGLPKSTIIFDNSGNKVKETVNEYDFLKLNYDAGSCGSHGLPDCYLIPKRPLGLKCVKCVAAKNSSQRNTTWSDAGHYNNPTNYITNSSADMDVEQYEIYTGRVELKNTIEKTYKVGTFDNVQNRIDYFYNNNVNSYEVNRVMTSSASAIIDKYLYYTSDYSGGPISILRQNNILSLPVSTSTFVRQSWPSSIQGYLNEEVTEFIQLPSGDIRPMRNLEQRFSTPSSTMVNYQGPGSNISAYKITMEFSYEGNNLVSVTDEGGRKITNLHGYGDKYITASVINADAASDYPAHTSFEVNGDFGKWSKTGPGSENTTTAITGKISYNFETGGKPGQTGTKLTRTLNTAKPYIVSFWATTASITVSGGATLAKTGPVVNGFTYYEYDIAQGTAIVEVSGTGTVDEVRCYPKDARMRSISYDPVIGKTSECDENNRITYYEYNKMGRLQFIKDENRNVIKMYEYNNISTAKQNGCPGIYYNKLITEIFVRNNCGIGYLGGEVTVTVPANTYSSVLNQADADAQAEAWLIANGQTSANTNGTCILLYFNTQQSQIFTTESCSPGYIGGTVTYTVPAGRYWSIISQADANQKALDEIEANGEAWANEPPNAVCTPDSAPLWIWLEGAAWYCAYVPGFSEPHLIVKETDINPSSITYLGTRWSDTGPSDLCPTGAYYNTTQSGTFTRNNCPTGYVGSQVIYTVDQGTYSSTVSQSAADQLAINDVNANGQNYANANGTCTPSGGCGQYCGTVPSEKCINNICEIGIRINTNTWYDSGTGLWVCEFHYEWSDGSWSANYYEYSPQPCQVIN